MPAQLRQLRIQVGALGTNCSHVATKLKRSGSAKLKCHPAASEAALGRRCGDVAIEAAAAPGGRVGVVILSEAINAVLHQAGFLV